MYCLTRMHSSRMCTGRTLTVFRCLVWGGGVSPKKAEVKKKFPPPKKNWGGVPLTPQLPPPQLPPPPPKNWRTPSTTPPPRLTCKACWDTHPPPPPGTDLQGMLGYPPGTDLQGMLGYPPLPPVDRMTHACENITLAKTSFRPVIMDVVVAGIRTYYGYTAISTMRSGCI